MSEPTKYYGYDFLKSGTYRGFTIDGQDENISPYREYNHGDRITLIILIK